MPAKVTLSRRAAQIPPSPLRKLVALAEKAKAEGIEVFPLNIGQPDIATPPEVLEYLRDELPTVVSYTHSAGRLQLREAFCEYLAGHSISVNPEEIVVTCGGSEAVLFALGAVADPGDEILTVEPCYPNYIGFAGLLGVRLRALPTSIRERFALPDLHILEKYITPRTRAILISNPSNPTGHVFAREELETLAELAEKYNLFLIVDEVYRELCFGGRTHTSVLTLGIDHRAIMIESVSKRWSLCGARVGALISKNREVIDAVLRMAQARLAPPLAGQLMAEKALRLPQNVIEEIKQEFERRCHTLAEHLSTIEGVLVNEPEGAFYLMVELPVPDAEEFCRWLLTSFRYEGRTLLLAPGRGFYVSEGAGIREVRIAAVLNQEKLQQAMECLSAALQAYRQYT